MKVAELIEVLNQCEKNAEIKVNLSIPKRPTGGTLETIYSVKPVIDQETNKVSYMIDTGIGEEGRYREYKLKRED
ncbi:hypothetical protein [Terribacillus saccharophilus]|uniref:hypothetical protein n=1 Tax=Terribacillus saccharophilus TaxID=361277 RepID=UPI000C9CEBB1|nr:hypothetical protein [Terribacillus goriensis]